MTKLPIGETAISGLSLARREPLIVVTWGLVIFVLGVLPALGMLGSLVEPFRDLILMQQNGIEPTFNDIMGLQLRMMSMQPLFIILSIVLRSVLAAAVFRAVLEPAERRLAYLRFGKVELWLILLALVFMVLALGVVLAAAIFIGILTGLSHVVGGEALAALIGVLGGFAVVGVVCWLALRMCMAFPMTFAARHLQIFESWAFTRGHAGALLLIFLIVVVIIWLLEVVTFGVLGAVGIAVAGASHFDAATIEGFFSRPPEQWVPALAPWALGIGLIASLFGGLVLAVTLAPLATAYRRLAPQEPEVASFTPETTEAP